MIGDFVHPSFHHLLFAFIVVSTFEKFLSKNFFPKNNVFCNKMDNPENVFHLLEEFSKLEADEIPQELEDYIKYVARTGETVFQWSLVKNLLRRKLASILDDFVEDYGLNIPYAPNVSAFDYEVMREQIMIQLDKFTQAPFTVQRLCELLATPRKEYARIDKYMRAVEKNVIIANGCIYEINTSTPPSEVNSADTTAILFENDWDEGEEDLVVENGLEKEENVPEGQAGEMTVHHREILMETASSSSATSGLNNLKRCFQEAHSEGTEQNETKKMKINTQEFDAPLFEESLSNESESSVIVEPVDSDFLFEIINNTGGEAQELHHPLEDLAVEFGGGEGKRASATPELETLIDVCSISTSEGEGGMALADAAASHMFVTGGNSSALKVGLPSLPGGMGSFFTEMGNAFFNRDTQDGEKSKDLKDGCEEMEMEADARPEQQVGGSEGEVAETLLVGEMAQVPIYESPSCPIVVDSGNDVAILETLNVPTGNFPDILSTLDVENVPVAVAVNEEMVEEKIVVIGSEIRKED